MALPVRFNEVFKVNNAVFDPSFPLFLKDSTVLITIRKSLVSGSPSNTGNSVLGLSRFFFPCICVTSN